MQKQLKCLLNLSWICFSFSYRKLKKKSFMDSHNLRVSFPKLIKKGKTLFGNVPQLPTAARRLLEQSIWILDGWGLQVVGFVFVCIYNKQAARVARTCCMQPGWRGLFPVRVFYFGGLLCYCNPTLQPPPSALYG